MNRPELYNKTVGILVDAYFNDTLVQGDCNKCAIGNLIAHHLGGTGFIQNTVLYETLSGEVVKVPWGGYDNFSHNARRIEVSELIGYGSEDIYKIEMAFELPYSTNIGEDMFTGLMAVIEALDIIHENTDIAITQTAKSKFQRVPA